MLDCNKGCPRILWNSSEHQNSRWMSNRMSQQHEVRRDWLGAKQHWEIMLDSKFNCYQSNNGTWSYYSLWAGSYLCRFVTFIVLTLLLNYRDAYLSRVYIPHLTVTLWFYWTTGSNLGEERYKFRLNYFIFIMLSFSQKRTDATALWEQWDQAPRSFEQKRAKWCWSHINFMVAQKLIHTKSTFTGNIQAVRVVHSLVALYVALFHALSGKILYI